MKAWIKQDPKQVKKVGEEKASYYCEWIDPDGKKRCKSFGPGSRGKNAAAKHKKKIEAQLLTGTYNDPSSKSWNDFRKEYETKILESMEFRSRESVEISLRHFERLIKPKKMSSITSQTIDTFISKRRKEKKNKEGPFLSKATINKDLRNLRCCLRKAKKWKYLTEVPEFDFLRETKKIPTYVSPEDFTAIYQNSDAAKRPDHIRNIEPVDWWKGLLMTGYMTGWRIGELLSLRWEDIDFEQKTALIRGEESKGRRDAITPLHDVILHHLATLRSFENRVFPWRLSRRALYTEFAEIQQKARVQRSDGKNYGFHDLRRAFGTMNADRMSADALQALMRHQSYLTTQRYINMARQLKPAVEDLFVPDINESTAGDVI